VLKNQETIDTGKQKKSVSLLGSISIILLVFINLFLLYNLGLNVLHLENEPAEVIQSDSLKRKIRVEVLNGCGTKGIADKLTDYLRRNSFDVVNIGNYRSFEVEESIIIDRTGSIYQAVQVAVAMGLSEDNIISQVNKEYLLDVSVILGKDYQKILPLRKRS
jgi:hypothetical protein